MLRRSLLWVLVVFLVMGNFGIAYADTSFNQELSQLEEQYGLPQGCLGKIANVESGGNATAGSPGAAYGMFQWFARYWQPAAFALYGKYVDPAERANPSVAAKVTAFSLAQAQSTNGALITQAGVDPCLGLYMNHFLGISGAAHFLQAYMQSPGANASAIFPKEAANNASVFGGRSLSQVLNEMARRLQVSGVVNVGGNFADGNGISYAYSNADLSSQSCSSTPYPVPSGPDPNRTYQTTYTPTQNMPLMTPQPLTQPVLNQTTPTGAQTSVTQPQASALLIVQPTSVTAGQPIVVSWTSVGIDPNNPCTVSENSLQFAQGNASSTIIQTTASTANSLMFTLACVDSSGKQIQQSSTVSVL